MYLDICNLSNRTFLECVDLVDAGHCSSRNFTMLGVCHSLQGNGVPCFVFTNLCFTQQPQGDGQVADNTTMTRSRISTALGSLDMARILTSQGSRMWP